jgi:hypothetical protein
MPPDETRPDSRDQQCDGDDTNTGSGGDNYAEEDAVGEVEDTGMDAMEVLAQGATMVSKAQADAEGDHDPDNDDDKDEEDRPPGRGGGGGSGPGMVVPKYACAHCSKLFTRPSSLRIHTYSRKSLFDLTPWEWR